MTTDLGYYFYPLPQPGAWGHAQLDFNIYDEPTGVHFDPIEVQLWVVKGDQELERLTLSHPWTGVTPLWIGPGRVTLEDYRDKVVTAFTFGGELGISNCGLYTSCQLNSPAPIIHLVAGPDIETILVTEFESLLARRRAEWAGNETGFEARLTAIEPLTLFIGGLVTIKEHLQHIPAQMRSESHRQELHIVNEAIEIVQQNEHWPASPPTLAELL